LQRDRPHEVHPLRRRHRGDLRLVVRVGQTPTPGRVSGSIHAHSLPRSPVDRDPQDDNRTGQDPSARRFPGLTVLFLEANGGWIVPWLKRLDHHAEVFSWDVPWLRQKPSVYFRRQCYISFDPDESTLAFTARHPLVGAERMVWASDYPHPDAKFPGVVRELEEATASLPAAARALIVGENARRLYHLPVAD
jgi:predicted TIM-barrel fold metal-dependent hydrolase